VHRLAVNYPASSWWVTGVGGTNLMLNSANQITSQVVWNDTDVQPGSAGGGGSSELFRRPFYQRGTVRSRARAMPDVSMLADIIPGYAVYCSAQPDCINSNNSNPWQSVGGTSAATPLLAGGFALIDQQLRMQQRQDLGLVNPLLYEVGRSSTLSSQAFDDVLSYGNDVGPLIPGNGRPLGCCNATAGYDKASGWGSLNLASFAAIAVAMQPPSIALSLPAGQLPVKHRAILATVTCAGACRIGAYAEVWVGRRRAFKVDSRIDRLPSQGAVTLPLRFSHYQLRKLHAALARHRHVSATVFGVMITGRRTVERRTDGIRLTIGR
jgi:hypothetical protein